MAAIDQMQKAERMLRKLLEREGLPEPDDVEYAGNGVNFVWHDQMVVVQIEVD
ncbi:MAG: hypothetical protein ABSG43_31290 [Solirubrobacteraceae bacterium]|jgi:hypothetical protein